MRRETEAPSQPPAVRGYLGPSSLRNIASQDDTNCGVVIQPTESGEITHHYCFTPHSFWMVCSTAIDNCYIKLVTAQGNWSSILRGSSGESVEQASELAQLRKGVFLTSSPSIIGSELLPGARTRQHFGFALHSGPARSLWSEIQTLSP